MSPPHALELLVLLVRLVGDEEATKVLLGIGTLTGLSRLDGFCAFSAEFVG